MMLRELEETKLSLPKQIERSSWRLIIQEFEWTSVAVPDIPLVLMR